MQTQQDKSCHTRKMNKSENSTPFYGKTAVKWPPIKKHQTVGKEYHAISFQIC